MRFAARSSITLTCVLVAFVPAATGRAAVPHTVESGETLWSIAFANGFETRALAAYNGLSEDADVMVGATILIPTVAEARDAVAASGTPLVEGSGGDNFSSSAEVGQIGAEYGFAPGLPAAIAYMESGFNQDVVSEAGARGVMQVLPSTFDWVSASLAGVPLDSNSRVDNIHAGVIFLHYLWHETGGDVEQTVAAYYQGLASVREYGLFPETERYVADVLALRERFVAP